MTTLPALADRMPYQRVFTFLEAMRAVHLGHACLTEVGAEYLGVPFQFPSLAYDTAWEAPIPDTMRKGH